MPRCRPRLLAGALLCMQIVHSAVAYRGATRCAQRPCAKSPRCWTATNPRLAFMRRGSRRITGE
eukprot:scaffold245570_cov19-Tisochrysis_lutea.AAC.1